MTTRKRPAVAGIVLAGLATVLWTGASVAQDLPKVHPRPIIIIGGTLIDGSGAPPRRNDAIVIQDGRIKAMGLAAAKKAPRDARLIDASGRWIVPGLIDAAVHLSGPGGVEGWPGGRRAPAPYLRAYLCSGITTVLDVGGTDWSFDLRSGRADDALSPRIATTGPALPVAGGPARAAVTAAALVERLARMSPDLVAVRVDLPAGAGPHDAVEIVAAAHARRLRAVTDAATSEQLRTALDTAADVVVLRVSEPIDDELAKRVARQRTVIVPAMVVGDAGRRVFSRQKAVTDIETACAPASSLAAWAGLDSLNLDAMAPPAARSPEGEQRNLKQLAELGVAIAAGSGAGALGAFHGTSLHREFELMAAAGLTPMQILLAATRDSARALGRESEVGQVKEGMAGDLVLLDADPLQDIRNLRRVVQAIRGGAIYER